MSKRSLTKYKLGQKTIVSLRNSNGSYTYVKPKAKTHKSASLSVTVNGVTVELNGRQIHSIRSILSIK